MLEGARATFRELALAEDVLAGAVVAADAGFHTEANVQYLDETHVDGYLADTLFRQRDPRFATAERQRATALWVISCTFEGWSHMR